MPRQNVTILLGLPTNYSVLPLKYIILELNKMQTQYEFSFPDCQNICQFEEAEYPESSLFSRIESIRESLTLKADYTIAIITSKISGNLFWATNSKCAAITTNMWEKIFSPPSLFEYLLHSITACLILMHPSLNLDIHPDTRGCILDYTRWKHDERIDIALGYICEADCNMIRKAVGKSYLDEIQLLLSRKWIGSITDNTSIAYNLKHFFAFDIHKDSGFNKNFWERAKTKFDELPFEIVKMIIDAVIAVLLAAILVILGLKAQ